MITNLGYWWKLTGENFLPDEVERLTGIIFESKNNKGDPINPYKKEPYSEGIAILDAGDGFKYWPLSPEDALLSTIETHHDLFRRSGADKFVMYYTIGYHAQCNLEFSPQELLRLTRVGATLAISCVELDEEEFAGQEG
jgi:hypothetical protein